MEVMNRVTHAVLYMYHHLEGDFRLCSLDHVRECKPSTAIQSAGAVDPLGCSSVACLGRGDFSPSYTSQTYALVKCESCGVGVSDVGFPHKQ